MIKFKVDTESIIKNGSCRVEEERNCGGADFQTAGPVKFDLTIRRVVDDISVSGAVSVFVVLNCSRCLQNFSKEITIQINFARKFDWDNETEIDMYDELRSGILLAAPMKPLCRQNCGGLCPHCGVNLNEKKCGCKNEAGEFNAFSKLKQIISKQRG